MSERTLVRRQAELNISLALSTMIPLKNIDAPSRETNRTAPARLTGNATPLARNNLIALGCKIEENAGN